MKCYIERSIEDKDLIEFLYENAINQQFYFVEKIYEDMKNYDFNYIICKNKNNVLGAMPFILYKNKYGNIIHSMPYVGYGGIVSDMSNKEEIYSLIINFLKEYAKKENVILTTICMYPFYNDYELYKKYFDADFERKNFYQYLDLNEDVFKNMTSKFRGNLRRNIKKSQNYGVKLVESYSLEDLYQWYHHVYLKRLNETGCAIYPYSVFETYIRYYDKNRVKMVYGKLDDKIIAGGLFLNQGLSVDNFMRVVDGDYFHTQVGTFIDHWSIEYAKKTGARYYNWQSCDSIDSPIFKYKKDWGSKSGYHYYLTKITGDISQFKRIPLEIIKESYKGIYVMPYEAFENQ
ncbi:GNAT family N-acetyltransferase [Lutibacter sp. B2]|nr:GNAT family N-acetyltransferase [Lutibacter sp. B2]